MCAGKPRLIPPANTGASEKSLVPEITREFRREFRGILIRGVTACNMYRPERDRPDGGVVYRPELDQPGTHGIHYIRKPCVPHATCTLYYT